MEDKTSHNMTLWFFLICFLVSIYLLGKLIWPFLSIIILAAVLAGIFYPVFRFFYIKDKINANFASFLTCLLIFFILFIPIIFFVGILSKEAYELYQAAKGAVLSNQLNELLQNSRILDKVNIWLGRFNIHFTGADLNSAISETGKVVGLFLYEQAMAIASNTLTFLVDFCLMLLVIFFLLIDGNRLIKFITSLSPLPKEQDETLINKFREIAGAILLGNGLGGAIQGVAGGLVFWIFGLPSAFLWGVVMGLLAFLPIVGIAAVFLPTAIYLFLVGRIGAGLFFIVFYIFLSGSVEYIFKPRLVGKRVKMHTLLVFFSIIGGMKMFGILGIIYGPLVVTAFITLAEIYQTDYQTLIEQ